MTTIGIIASVLLLIGGFFSLVAALGVFRFGDFYARVHAATKASTFGLGFVAIAVALTFNSSSAWWKVLATIVFFFLTLPIAAHLLGKAYRQKAGSHCRKSASGT